MLLLTMSMAQEATQVTQLPATQKQGPWGLTMLSKCMCVLVCPGVLVAEGAFSLKLIDKGVPKETLAFLVLFQVLEPF